MTANPFDRLRHSIGGVANMNYDELPFVPPGRPLDWGPMDGPLAHVPDRAESTDAAETVVRRTVADFATWSPERRRLFRAALGDALEKALGDHDEQLELAFRWPQEAVPTPTTESPGNGRLPSNGQNGAVS